MGVVKNVGIWCLEMGGLLAAEMAVLICDGRGVIVVVTHAERA